MSNQSNYEDYPAIGVSQDPMGEWPSADSESPMTVWVTVPWRDHARMYQLQARDGHRRNIYADAVAEYLVNHGDPGWFAEVWPGAESEDHGSAPMYPTRAPDGEQV
jgi:hypothetical protein